MAKKKRRPERKPEKITKYRKPININLGLIIFGVLFVYIVIIVVSYFRSEHITPYEVTLGSLAVNNTYVGVALREETVIPSDYSGYVNYYARENEKIANGSMVYTVDTTGKLSEMVNENTGDGSSLTDEDLSELKTEISDFSTSFQPRDFSNTYDFKFNIEGTVLKLANYKVLSSIDSLASSNLSDSINFGYAPQSGVIVYSTDGYETLTPETLTPELMDPANYTKSQFHSNDLIAQGDPAYKLVYCD